MDLTRIETAVRKERQKSELNPLDESFYTEVSHFLDVLYSERKRAAEQAEDPFSSSKVKQITDEIETVEETVESLYERRSGKIVKAASFASAGMAKELDGATNEEKELFNNLVEELNDGRERVLNTINESAQESEQDTENTVATPGDGGGDSVNNSVPGRNGTLSESHENESKKTLDASVVMGGRTSDGTDTTSNVAGSSNEEPESISAEGDRSVPDDIERTTVRVTKEVGEILGTDNREYYLYEEDVVTLPKQNANILVEKGAAVTVDS